MSNYLVEIDGLLLRLNEDQLRIINRKIVERLKLINRAKSTVSLARFNLGDRAYFLYNGRKMPGAIIRLNQKTATLRLDDGKEWLVAPGLLTKIIEQ
ncbi:MAG: hypothetical protein HYV53_01815 [Parcubacteria group bacterium]|nr:hypothetical protein [Parcubacteria group bacterium]